MIDDVYLKEIDKLQEQVVRLESENIKLKHLLKQEKDSVAHLNKYISTLVDRYERQLATIKK
jgi:predicted nuclease with TOPRIM domain